MFSSQSGTNYTGWKGAEYDKHLAEASSTLDMAARLAAYGKAEKILVQDQAVILPLFYKKNTVLLGPKVREFQISPLNYLFLKRVTVSPDKQ